jgi:hypothetical protein
LCVPSRARTEKKFYKVAKLYALLAAIDMTVFQGPKEISEKVCFLEIMEFEGRLRVLAPKFLCAQGAFPGASLK